MTLSIQIFENNQIIKTFKSVKTLEKYMRKHQLENGMPLKYKKIADNSFNYSYEDINGNLHNLLLVFTV